MSITPGPTFPQGVPTDEWFTYGPLVSAGNVRTAVLALLADPVSGIAGYLGEIERQNNLTPPGILGRPASVSSYRAGIDLTRWESDVFPLLIVLCQPDGQPARFGGGEYGQTFAVTVAAVISNLGNQEQAIAMADCYGIAVAACVGQHGGLAKRPDGTTLATNTVLYEPPRTEFPSASGPRDIVRSVTVFHSYVQPIFAERYGPPLEQTPYAPGASTYPTTDEVKVTLSVVPLDSYDNEDPVTTETT